MGNFLLGLGVGLIGGALFAPRSGAETRAYLRHKADEGTDYVRQRASDGAEYVRERSGDVGTMASQAVEKGKEMLGVGQQTSSQSHQGSMRPQNQRI